MNYIKPFFYPLLLLPCVLKSVTVYAQAGPAAAVKEIAAAITSTAENRLQEKLYLQTDKPFYAVNDTLWFKAYLFNAPYLTQSPKSGIVYIEIANDQNEVVKRAMVPVYTGLGWGNIALTDVQFPQGNYYLRAYTNWMRNYDAHYMFTKQFYISSPGEGDLLIKSKFSTREEAGIQKASVNLKLTNAVAQPVLLTDYQVKITEGNKTWMKDKVQTYLEGALDFNFNIPEKANTQKLELTLQAVKKNEESPEYTIPILLNRPENTDLQFMPEGGYLCAGMETRIAFKALAEDGQGTEVSGEVYNSKQQVVAAFQSAHLGLGAFTLRPLGGETYTARFRLPGNTYSRPYALPVVKPSGVSMNIGNALQGDSLDVSIAATSDVLATQPIYYLIGQSRGITCYGAIVRLKQAMHIKISKSLFPTGIARLTLLNGDKQAMNERISYIEHNDHLNLQLVSDKKVYTTRDSVGMNITVTDQIGKPMMASFSVAVTDDSQVKCDSLKDASLKSAILLTSDLKGEVEGPGYYFPPAMTAAIWQNLDNLLLAQGWVNYDWQAVFQPIKPAVNPAEKNYTITGKVTNILNHGVERSGVVLLAKKPTYVRDTITNKEGIFTFTNIYPADTAVYFIQARNRGGGSFNVGIEVNEFKPPVFAAPKTRIIPWYMNTDSGTVKMLNNVLTYKKEQKKLIGANMMTEVTIVDKKIIHGSKNLNGDGGSDFALTQDFLSKAGKVTLGDLLTKYIKGFHLGNGKQPYRYFVHDKLFHLIIDGINIDFGKPQGQTAYDYQQYVQDFLDHYTADDIKGIELMESGKYSGTYYERFLNPRAVPYDHAWVEVTTYAGTGPYLHNTPGTYMYKPIAFVSDKQFYSPKYTSKTDHTFIDTRSTIYWLPNIITDKSGKARFNFYTADKPGTYTILIDGCDMNGNLESMRAKLVVK